MTTNSKLDSHFSKHYDEKQLVDRYKISFETLILTFVLIAVDGFVKIFWRDWAPANVEMAVLLFIPLAYFIIRSVQKGAYFAVRQKSYTTVLVLFAAAGLLNLATFVFLLFNGVSIIENGMLSENLFQLIVSIPFLSLPIAYLIKRKRDVNNDE